MTTRGYAGGNAFYCPFDPSGTENRLIYFPVDMMAQMWTGDVFNRRVQDRRVPCVTPTFRAGTQLTVNVGHHHQRRVYVSGASWRDTAPHDWAYSGYAHRAQWGTLRA